MQYDVNFVEEYRRSWSLRSRWSV